MNNCDRFLIHVVRYFSAGTLHGRNTEKDQKSFKLTTKNQVSEYSSDNCTGTTLYERFPE